MEDYKIVFIVEGRYDVRRVREAMLLVAEVREQKSVTRTRRFSKHIDACLEQVHFLVTGGTRFNQSHKSLLDIYIIKGYKVYILSDPDNAGQRVEEMVHEFYPNIPRIDLDLNFSKNARGFTGVEHTQLRYLAKKLRKTIFKEYDFKANKPLVRIRNKTIEKYDRMLKIYEEQFK